MVRLILSTLFITASVFSFTAQAQSHRLTLSEEAEHREFLRRFHADPAKVLDEYPVMKDAAGNVVRENATRRGSMDPKKYIAMRDQIRSQLCTVRNGRRYCLKDNVPGKNQTFSGLLQNENPEIILETSNYIKNMEQMEMRGLTVGTVAKQPWSETFWPMTKGLIGNRYADHSFPKAKDWITNFSYISMHPATSIGNINILAPSEKYDLLIGDNGLPVTRGVWAMGQYYQETYGQVWGWMGICHGWSGASIAFDEPVNPIVTSTADGRSITLYPSDIKGLASLLWATAPPIVHFIGERCKQGNPAKDIMGRIIPAIDEDGNEPCVDVNPGTWHMTAANLVGAQQQSYVLDATYDLQVWNHPVYHYEYSYFNPQTLELGSHWRQAMVPMALYTIDKFKTYRSPNAKSVIGVFMKVTIMDDSSAPSQSTTTNAKKKEVTYVYDLEIDAQGNIIGGEWYSNHHPDFLWRGPSAAKATALGDYGVNPADWDGVAPIPEGWREPASKSARLKTSNGEPEPQPLAAIVEKLVERSK